jgi:Uma2 family endonuclease
MITPAITRKKFTAAEYEQIIAAGVLAEDDRVELLEGEIVEMSPIGPSHSGCVVRLTGFLYKLDLDRVMVRVQDPIHLGEYSEPQPDISVVHRRPDYYSGGHPEPEDIVLLIEVAESSLSYDREVKLPLYARSGIPEVWIISLQFQTVDIFRSPVAGHYTETFHLVSGETLTAVDIPEFKLPIGSLFD